MSASRAFSVVSATVLMTSSLIAASGAFATPRATLEGPTYAVKVLEGPNTGLRTPTGIAFDDAGQMYVSNKRDNTITVYPYNWSTGNVAPLKTLSGANTLLNAPVAIAFDADQQMYVVNLDSITVYAPDWSTGDTSPVKVLSGSSTGLKDPSGLAFDSIGRMYVANSSGAIGSALGSITVYGDGWTAGDTKPMAVLGGAATGLLHPSSLAFDEAGFMYVTNSYGVTAYEPGWDAGDTAPVRVLAGPGSGMTDPRAVNFGDDGYMYVLNIGRGTIQRTYITVHDPNWATGPTPPVSVIYFDDWLLRQPQAMTFDDSNLLYVTRDFQHSVAAFQTQTLSLDPVDDVAWNTSTTSVTASSTSGSPVTITTTSPQVCSGSGISPVTVTIKAMGTCTFEATQDGEERVAPAPPITGSFQVTTASQTITVSGPTSVSVTKRWARVKAATTSGLPVVWTTQTPDVCVHRRGFGQRVQLKATGTCTMSAYQPGNSLWSSEGPVGLSFEVTP